MTIDDNDRAELNDQTDFAPAYPPSTRTRADAYGTEEEANVQIGSDRLTTDREVPRPPIGDAPADVALVEETALFERNELDTLNGRWAEIQTSFVRDPRRAVRQADALVADVITQMGDSFGKQRARLERQSERRDQISTEHLRQVFHQYRSLLSRLLGA